MGAASYGFSSSLRCGRESGDRCRASCNAGRRDRLEQVLQIDAALGGDDHAGEEVGQHGFLHVHPRRLGRVQRHIQAAQVQRLPGQQVLAGCQGIGPEFFQRHIAGKLGLRPRRGLAVGHAALEAGVGAQQLDIERVGKVRLKRLRRQSVHHQLALCLQRHEAHIALEIKPAGFKTPGGQTQGSGERHGFGRSRPGPGPVIKHQPTQLGPGRRNLKRDRFGAGLVGKRHGTTIEQHLVDGHGPGRRVGFGSDRR